METMKRGEIDTTAPFKTVKEAVVLFGERVLANQVYSNHLKVMQDDKWEDQSGIETELEVTKHDLKRAKEESKQMRNSLSSLKEELERTKQELQKLRVDDPEEPEKNINETVFKTKFEVLVPCVDDEPIRSPRLRSMNEKRYVKFVNPSGNNGLVVDHMFLERHPSMKMNEKKTKTKPKNKNKKKSLIPLFIGGMFSKKKVLQ